MPTATDQFFADLAQRGEEPLLRSSSGNIRFEIGEKGSIERWFVAVDHGRFSVSRRNQKADCAISADADVFENIVTGKDNAFAALLRGALEADGDLELLQLFQRVFRGPIRSTHPAADHG
ncbi:SCP2 sterol-binding domain-containing protein [Catellatospora methionotrophica]|uniref:SCP2 sterol-binding domain-containing protein n=1 Tax=Catellatospora methionotrophica TaxID=121620 RepID=UPI0033EEA7B1